MLPATWTAVRKLDSNASEDVSQMQLSRWWSSNPSQLAGIGARKGQIAKGFDADFMVRGLAVTWSRVWGMTCTAAAVGFVCWHLLRAYVLCCT